MTTQYVSIVNG